MSLDVSARKENRQNLRIVHGACPHDCPDTCALETLVDEQGKAVRVRGRADHPLTLPRINDGEFFFPPDDLLFSLTTEQ